VRPVHRLVPGRIDLTEEVAALSASRGRSHDVLAAVVAGPSVPRRAADPSALKDCAQNTSFAAGSRLFDEDGEADRFWLIQSGRVALDLHAPGRGDVVIETLADGDVLGWSWLFRAVTVAFRRRGPDRYTCDRVRRRRGAVAVRRGPVLGFALTRRFLRRHGRPAARHPGRLLDLYAEERS
jgi:CRP-like cAMP-binding protein